MAAARVGAALRWALLRNSLRGRGAAGRVIALGVGLLVGGMAAVVALALLTTARGDGDVPVDIATVLFSGLLFCWVVLPVVTASTDELLDPGRLALYPLTSRDRLILLGVGALLGPGTVLTVVATVGLVPATADGVSSTVVAAVAVLLQVLMCVALGRAVVTALSGLLSSRRGRDLGVVVAALFVIVPQGLNIALQRGAVGAGGWGDGLHRYADPLRWTPPGLLAAAPGRPLGPALASLAAVALLIAVAAWWWSHGVRAALARPPGGRSGRRRRTGLTPAPLRRLLPPGRAGAVAAKDLRYLVRQPRRLAATVSTTVVPVALVVGVGTAGAGGGPALAFLACPTAVLLGAVGANRFGLDGSAAWTLIASSTDRRDSVRDLAGGDLAAGLVVLPVALGTAVLLGAVGGGRHLPAALGMTVALGLTSIAVSGAVAVSAPMAVPESSNVFATGDMGQGCLSGLLTFAGWGAATVLCLPLLAPLLLSLETATWGVVLLIAGPAYGVAMSMLVRRWAAGRWAGRGPEVLAAVTSPPS